MPAAGPSESPTRSPLGALTTPAVYPPPRAVVDVVTTLAPIRRSFAYVVATGPLSVVALLPDAPAAASRGAFASIPLYSKIRTSGLVAAVLNVTVTALEPAGAATMFFAK